MLDKHASEVLPEGLPSSAATRLSPTGTSALANAGARQADEEACFVEIQGLGKTYKRRSWFKRVLGRLARDSDDIDDDEVDHGTDEEIEDRSSPDGDRVVLRGIDLRIDQGEVVGIVGRTGSGKSTLLDILCNLTLPTSGRIVGKGRILPLHTVRRPLDALLSGRRNLEIYGRMNGFTREEVADAIAPAVDDTGFRDKIDERVHRYSTSDFMELSYSFALHLEPDILVVDGPLAVGDAHTQRAFLERLFAFPGRDRILIVCTSKISTLRDLCTRAIWLENGAVAGDGPPMSVIESYLQTAKLEQATGALGRGTAAVANPEYVPPVYRHGPAWFRETGMALYLGAREEEGFARLSTLKAATETGVRPSAPAAWDEVERVSPHAESLQALRDGIAALRAREAAETPDFGPLDRRMDVWGTMRRLRLLSPEGKPTQIAAPGETMTVEAEVEVARPDTRMAFLLSLAASEPVEGLLDKGPKAFETRRLLFSRIPHETIFERPGLYRVRVELPGALTGQTVDDIVMDLTLTLVLRNGSPGFGGVERRDLSYRQIVDILRRRDAGEHVADIVPVEDTPPDDPTERMLCDQLLRNLPPLPKAPENFALSWIVKGSLNVEVQATPYTSDVRRGTVALRPTLPMAIERARDGSEGKPAQIGTHAAPERS